MLMLLLVIKRFIPILREAVIWLMGMLPFFPILLEVLTRLMGILPFLPIPQETKIQLMDLLPFITILQEAKIQMCIRDSTIPAEGLLDLFTTAEQQGKKLKAIRTYKGIKNGHETLVYVGVDENNNDLITNADYGINYFDNGEYTPIEDEVNGCPGTCLTAPNVLTGK